MAKLTITLQVANEKLKLNVNSEDEKYFRDAAEEIEQKLLAYQSKIKSMSIETAMRYALVDATVSKLRKEGTDSGLEASLDKLHSDLDAVILKHS